MEEYTIVDLGILIGDTLVIADPHIGYEEALTKDGVMVPRFHLSDLLARLEGMIISAVPKRIVINGDVKHDFGKISDQEWRDSRSLIQFLKGHAEVVLVKGNHDQVLDVLAVKNGVVAGDSLTVGGFFLTHGDVIPPGLEESDCHTIVIGHEHPAVSLRDGGRVERFKSFLETTWKKKRLIVLPSCNLVTEGHDLVKEKPISPFLSRNLAKSRVYLISEPGKVLDFGEFSRLRK